jgi:hypothetical protein
MKVVILLPITEIARKGRVCDETLKRKVAAANVKPDALLQAGKKRVPLFVRPRAEAILALCTQPQIKA